MDSDSIRGAIKALIVICVIIGAIVGVGLYFAFNYFTLKSLTLILCGVGIVLLIAFFIKLIKEV